MAKERRKKRAIALAGGGPAAGFHIGALKALEDRGVKFDVWSLSCIGAWVGIYFNQLDGPNKADRTYTFFREHGFRDAASYNGFPVNKAFAPNLEAVTTGWLAHASDPQTYRDVFAIGNEWHDVVAGWMRFMSNPQMWTSKGDINVHVLNNILAVHPMSRFLTSLIYLSGTNGLSNIYYPDSSFLADIRIENLDLAGKPGMAQMTAAQLDELASAYALGKLEAKAGHTEMPEIYHNAWQFGPRGANGKNGEGRLQLFNNKWLEYRKREHPRNYMPITHASLCACSALPYIEQTVHIPEEKNGSEYSEGALIDTVCFSKLVEDHPDLDEIWVCRIVDYRQIRPPKNLHDSLANLCQQFAAEVGENDVRIFKNHLRKRAGRVPRVVEIPLAMAAGDINFRWDRDNLHSCFKKGQEAVDDLLEDQALSRPLTTAPPWPVPPPMPPMPHTPDLR